MSQVHLHCVHVVCPKHEVRVFQCSSSGANFVSISQGFQGTAGITYGRRLIFIIKLPNFIFVSNCFHGLNSFGKMVGASGLPW